ncbi:MAG: M56 family metallopeptidase [Actinomycetota bacterium]|nr:M56 family metallopeptidase [Actinomycetota bacterium]
MSRAQHAGRIEPWLGEHRRFDSWELVVLPCDELFALSVPGTLSQVVVSRGLSTTLAPAELAAVVAHERSHLAHGHHHYLLLVAVVSGAFGFVPGVRRSVSTLRVALERWADEDAAERNERRCVAAALARASYLPAPEGLAAFGAPSMILERLQALESPPVPRTLRRAMPIYVVIVGLAMASVGVLASQAGQLRVLGSLVSRCL